MSRYEIALLLHIGGAIAYSAGIALAAVAFVAARGRERPSEIAAVLTLARTGVLLALVGTAVLLGFPLWLVDMSGSIGIGDAWVSAALTLFVAAADLGGLAGQAPKRARKLAADLAARDDRATPELERLRCRCGSPVRSGVGVRSRPLRSSA